MIPEPTLDECRAELTRMEEKTADAFLILPESEVNRYMDGLKAAIRRKESKLAAMACDWADDHTHLQSLCRAAGIPVDRVEGDSHGVPGIGDLADMLAGQVSTLRAEVERLRARLAEVTRDRDALLAHTRERVAMREGR